jgi:hypothetical protein
MSRATAGLISLTWPNVCDALGISLLDLAKRFESLRKTR